MAVFTLLLACAATIAARLVFVRISARAAVDHYYWILAARAYRQAKCLPAVIEGKYLLEDERQFYPPLFGWMLAKFPERLLIGSSSVWIVQAADAAVLVLLMAYELAAGMPLLAIAIVVAVFGTAPVLAAYNTQISSRAFGNLFLVICLLSLAEAVAQQSPVWTIVFYAIAVAGSAAVVLTHKMTTQLLLALWPFCPWAFGSWFVAIVPPLGIVVAALLTGFGFARMQWLAHADIVSFWHRHRHEVGAHAFAHSPIYGEPSRCPESAFHRAGWRGALGHAVLAFSYGPLVWLLPLTLLSEAWPPAWILLWTLGTGAVVLLTLYVPWLRCLGGGHLYMFNAIAPAALWWGIVLPGAGVTSHGLFALGGAATLVSLVAGYHRRAATVSRRDQGFENAIATLASMPPGRIAVFPSTAVEEVAFRSPHAVLWGAHGLGFRRLEPVFPTLKISLRTALAKFACDLLLFDTRYWPQGAEAITAELPNARIRAFGSWRLVVVSDDEFDNAADASVRTETV